MDKIMLGKTGIQVSRMCFGVLTIGPVQANLPLEKGGEILAHAISKGVNFFDTAQLYKTYPYLKYAMNAAGKRDIVISSKTYAWNRELAVNAVEEALAAIDRDYIDIFMLHEQESAMTLRGHREALEVLYEYKAKGKIKAVGASMHHIAAVKGALKAGLDVIHPLINKNGLGIADGTRQEMEVAIKSAWEAGLGIFSMKPLGGGNLFKDASECLTYALGLQYVHSVAIGMQSIDEVDANIEFWESGEFTPQAKQALMDKNRRLHIDEWCTGCGTCCKRCSQNALELRGNHAYCDDKKCVLCGYCGTVCPEWAIKVV